MITYLKIKKFELGVLSINKYNYFKFLPTVTLALIAVTKSFTFHSYTIMEARHLSLFGLVSFGLFVIFYSLKKRSSSKKSSSHYKNHDNDEYIFPPLPEEVVSLLKLSKLCFLATANDLEPHLSLMNFTYFQVQCSPI